MAVYSTQEKFLQPVLQYNHESRLFRLVEDYTLEWGKPGFRKRLTMKAGFEYDKASVPRPLWGLARPDGEWEASALFHDRFYRDHFKPDGIEFIFETQMADGTWKKDSSTWKRSEADELLRFVGVMGGAGKVEALKYKLAVQLYPPNWFKH
jgi:hypothetical protein